MIRAAMLGALRMLLFSAHARQMLESGDNDADLR
jgi:hypothetical protein